LKISARLSQINWTADFLTPLAAIMMEAFCIFPWLVFMGRWPLLLAQRNVLNFPSVIVLIAGAYIITRFFLSRKIAVPLASLNIVFIGLILIFAVIRLEYSDGYPIFGGEWFLAYGRILLNVFTRLHPIAIAIPCTFFLYWRGISRAQSPMYFHNIYPVFLTGLGSLILLAVLWGISENNNLRDIAGQIGIFIAGYFFFGLFTLALTNLQNIRTRLKRKEGTPASFNRRWLGIVLGVITGIVAIGSGISSLFSSQVSSFLSRTIGFLWNLVERAAYYIFIPISYVVGWLLIFFQWLVAMLRRKQETQPAETLTPSTPPDMPNVITRSLSPETILILKWTFFTLVLATLVLFLVRAILRNRRTKTDDEINEEHESLWSWHGFQNDFKQWLDSLKNRFKWPEKPPVVRYDWDDETNSKLAIRQIYERLLWYTARLNIPRYAQETPYEYERRLKPAFREQQKILFEITQYYVNNRYGNSTEDEQENAKANALWDKLRPAFSQKLHEQQAPTDLNKLRADTKRDPRTIGTNF